MKTVTSKKRATGKRKTTVKRIAKRKTVKKVRKSVTLKAKPKPKIRIKPTNHANPIGISGSTASVKALKAVKAAKKEGEKTARKRLLKTNKAKMDRVLKSNNAKISRLLKQNNTRISKILRASGIRRKRKAVTKQRQRIENPFDARRFRGNRRKKKETAEQCLKRIEEHIHTVRDDILYGIATGAYKFKWASVAKETGYGNGERKKMLSILDNKGFTISKLAHKIWESDTGYGKSDDHEIRNEIIDVLHTVSSRTDALNQLDRGQGSADVPF
jgi:hypothetical protein